MDEIYHNSEDQFFQEHLFRDQEYPPANVWNKIEHELDILDKNERSEIAKRRIFFALNLSIVFSLLTVGIRDSKVHEYKKISQNGSRSTIVESKNESYRKNATHEMHLVNAEHADLLSLIQTKITESSYAESPDNSSKKIVVIAPENIVHLPNLKQFSQNNLTTKPALVIRKKLSSRFSIEPYFFKEFMGYNFSDNDITSANGKKIEERERTMFSASLGVYLNYHINRHWLVQSGLGLSWSVSNIDSSKTYAMASSTGNVQFKFNTISGYGLLNSPATNSPVAGDSLITTGTFSRLQYLSIPLIVSYQMPMKHFVLSVGAGAGLNILNSAYIETDVYKENLTRHDKEIPLRGLKKVNVGLIIKAEMGYQFNSKWGVSLISSFKNALGPINLHSALSAYPYNFGVGLGVTYQF